MVSPIWRPPEAARPAGRSGPGRQLQEDTSRTSTVLIDLIENTKSNPLGKNRRSYRTYCGIKRRCFCFPQNRQGTKRRYSKIISPHIFNFNYLHAPRVGPPVVVLDPPRRHDHRLAAGPRHRAARRGLAGSTAKKCSNATLISHRNPIKNVLLVQVRQPGEDLRPHVEEPRARGEDPCAWQRDRLPANWKGFLLNENGYWVGVAGQYRVSLTGKKWLNDD